MIDEKTLAEDEREQKMLADHYANKPEMVVTFKKRIAVIRNARRYLALRNAAKTQEGRVKVQAIFWHMASRKDIDAAADRLLEEYSSQVWNGGDELAATASSVPDVLIQLRDKVTRIPHRTEYLSGQQFAYVRLCEVVGEIDALLQSSQAALAVPNLVESHQIKAPDCRTCANRGQVNGLSQESYCESCVYQGRGYRQNHFVDASKMVNDSKRRCEACAILPCSCK